MPKNSLAAQIGHNIRNQRMEKGYSQEKLAIKSGVTSRSISRIERGETTPDIETLSKIGVALNAEFSVLIEGRLPVDYVSTGKKISLEIERCGMTEQRFIFRLLGYAIELIEELESRT